MDIWGAVEAERTLIADTFDRVSGEEWDSPSLCGRWTVRHLLGHLVIAADPPTVRFLRHLAKAGGRFDGANDGLARDEAARPVGELIAAYRRLATARNTPPGFGAEAPLADVLVHSMDVRIPLGLAVEPSPPERYEAALGLLLSRKGGLFFVPRGRPTVQWVATDHDWHHGTGAEVQGTLADLTLAASGRAARVEHLSGPGVAALTVWLEQ